MKHGYSIDKLLKDTEKDRLISLMDVRELSKRESIIRKYVSKPMGIIESQREIEDADVFGKGEKVIEFRITDIIRLQVALEELGMTMYESTIKVGKIKNELVQFLEARIKNK